MENLDTSVTINLRGTIFRTNPAKFQLFPNSLLAKQYAPGHGSNDELYFDRNPVLFHYILDLYESGDLHLPRNVCSSVLKKELKFWNLRKDTLGKCCIGTYYNDDDEVRIYGEYRSLLERNTFDDDDDDDDVKDSERGGPRAISSNADSGHISETKCMRPSRSVRKQIWKMLCEPFSTRCSKMYFATILASVAISIVVFAVSTLEIGRQHRYNKTFHDFDDNSTNHKIILHFETRQHRVLAAIDIASNMILTTDYALVMYSSPRRFRSFRSWYYLMDLFSLLSIYTVNFLDQTDLMVPLFLNYTSSVAAWIGFAYSFRMMRILRLLAFSQGWVALYCTFKSKFPDIAFFLFGFMAVCLISASLLYYSEILVVDSFPNLFVALWWAVVTLSSVGYGEIVPSSTAGQIIAVFVIIFGLLVIAIPFVIITSNYGIYFSCYINFKKHISPDKEEESVDENNVT